MPERSYPFVNGLTTDAEFSRMFAPLFGASILDGLAVTADASGLNVKLAPGAGFVRGHFYGSTEQQTLTIAGGDSAPRIDTIILRLEYGSVNAIHAVVKKGTPASSPVRPTLVQTTDGIYELALADITVAAGAVTIPASAVLDRRVWLAQSLQQSAHIFSGTAPANPAVGDLWFEPIA
jgi:hypothetical protein